jgi:hypothetical protein
MAAFGWRSACAGAGIWFGKGGATVIALSTRLLAFSVATLYIFETLLLFTFQKIFYQGHRHQYSSNTRICIYMVGKKYSSTVKTYSISIKISD